MANPRYPIYIISKGRADSRLTSKALETMGVAYSIVVEPQEFSDYAKVIDPKKIIQLPFSNLGKGSIPARNFVMEHSIEAGAARHWILDDNIRAFYRLHKNKRVPVKSGGTFAAAEDFVDRYENVAMAGMQYRFFCAPRAKWPAYVVNTRVYSIILLDNSIHHRWRGRYNEDTDLSLRILKDGLCTILFYAFLADKAGTMTMKGGNTQDLYEVEEGRLKMAKSLAAQHPAEVKVVRKWGRWQHSVDYSKFRANRLIKKVGLDIDAEPNNYGMRYVDRGSA